MSATTHPDVSLKFEALTYTVDTSATGGRATPIDKMKGTTVKRKLLIDITADVTSGHVLAIMGPSGAGKTTLLNMLTLEKKGGVPVGHIWLNGKPLTLGDYDQHCAYVQQFDTLWPSLTARDHLVYAMSLFQPTLSSAERNAAIDQLVKDVGLEDAQHTKAGNEFMRGLSGGLKRRLSIALALAKKPSVLFLDEPTTGVDSASAVMMMSFLKEYAKKANIAVVCTIHQPPASVFASFDNNLILSMGRVAYFGKAAAMGEYFGSIGRPPPANTNLAEFVLDLVNVDFTDVAGVTQILDAWSVDRGCYGVPAGPETPSEPLGKASARSGFCSQVVALTSRMLVVARREPLAYLVRAGANLMTIIFFAIIYVKTRDKEQNQIASKTYFIMFTLGIPMQFVLLSVFMFYHEWLSIKREVKDGMYHPSAAAIASWIVQTPMMFILGLFSLVPMYLIIDLEWESFAFAWLLYSITFWAFEGLGQMVSIAPSVILALFSYMNLYFMAFLFCGMFIDPADVVWPFRVFCYFLPLGWSLQSYMYAVWHPARYAGATPCTVGEITATGICDGRGFYCSSLNDPTGAVCFGETGDQILDSLSGQFTIFGSDPEIGRNIGLIVAFGVFCRLNYAFTLTAMTKWIGGQEPAPPSASKHGGSKHGADKIGPPAAAPSAAEPVGEARGLTIKRAAEGETIFSFSNVSYEVQPKNLMGAKKGPPKTILCDASARVRQGQVLAIVGPSGSGKTTLLNTITFVKGSGKPTGNLTLNGVPLTRSKFQRECVYVPREDNLWATMTARQHLSLAYELYRPELNAASRTEAIDALLVATGMTSCQHTKAGGLLIQGLSGGQRRRLSLALALVKEPRVIILDEPTSGLDSAAAVAITKLLKSIAVSTKSSIVYTIHQPSAAVFAGFDEVLVLSESRVAFRGPTNEMPAHFEMIGKPLAKEANPAEAVLDLVSKDISSKDAVKQVLDKWAGNPGQHVDVSADTAAGPVVSTPKPCSLFSSTFKVFRRQAMLTLTDPTVFWVKLIACPFVIAFFGLIYKESANNDQKQVPFRLFYLWWVLALPPCLNVISVITLSFETRSVIYEMRNGMYGAFSYVVSTTIVQIPCFIALSAAINVVSFAIGGWPFDNFLTFILVYAVNLVVYDSFAQLLAVLFRNPIVGMLIYIATWATSIIFCGLVFKGTDVIWPFRLQYYILPLKWSFNALGYDIWMPTTYNEAMVCTEGETIYTSQGVGACSTAGFYCPNATNTLGCWGATGAQVLETLQLTYESLDSKDDRGVDTLILVGMVVVLKIGFTGALWRTVTASDAPKKTPTTSTKPVSVTVESAA